MAKSALSTVRNNESYPKCGAEPVIRSRGYGSSLGCSQYPACDYVRPLKPSVDGRIVKALEGQVHPTCGTNLVLRQGRSGTFIGCSNHPKCEHTKLINKPDETVITRPRYRMDYLIQCRSHYGRAFHSCDRCPKCQFAINFELIIGECPECHYPLLVEKKIAQGVKHFCASE